MNNQFEDSASEKKLGLLREADPEREWKSLDDTRHCILCERTISGREVRVLFNRRGIPRLKCPTARCRATPSEWVHPENPLLSEEAWKDWQRLLGGDEKPARPARALPRSISVSPVGGLVSGWQAAIGA